MNAAETGEFVVNIVSEDIAEQMNLTAPRFPPDVNEFEIAKLTPAPSVIVKAPRVLESPINLECKVTQIIELSDRPDANSLVLGQVVYFHVNDAPPCMPCSTREGRIDPLKLRAIGRLGGTGYCRSTDVFQMLRPGIGIRHAKACERRNLGNEAPCVS